MESFQQSRAAKLSRCPECWQAGGHDYRCPAADEPEELDPAKVDAKARELAHEAFCRCDNEVQAWLAEPTSVMRLHLDSMRDATIRWVAHDGDEDLRAQRLAWDALDDLYVDAKWQDYAGKALDALMEDA